ncbi:hypothetical protein AB0M46_27430 [Dactylosporangium sp. NPDC051485]|uniref:PP_RS20740 family protein n=1 Tax=Dactylosporangium sp. NPDC051485 TaxID=3154846 RepID=UPI00341FB4D0
MNDDDFPLVSFEFPEVVEYHFKPWHRPRKQYVRATIWGRYIESLVAAMDQDRPVRYFGLPGADFLDIRYFLNQFCIPNERKIRFVGFDASTQEGDDDLGSTLAEMHASLDAIAASDSATDSAGSLASLRRSPNVDPRSKVLRRRLESIADINSVARRIFLDEEPFDIVNIDLCGGIFPKPDNKGQYATELYDALRQIFGLQNRHHRSWLFFLTIRVDDQTVPHQINEEMAELIESNMSSSAAFKRDLVRLFPQLSQDFGAGRRLNSSEIIVGIAKWLVRLGVSKGMDSEILDVAAYRILDRSGPLDMATVAFRFSPVIEVPRGRVPLRDGAPVNANEAKWAGSIPASVNSLVDVDELLEELPELKRRAAEETATLLAETGRYTPESYLDWVDSGEGWKDGS